MMIMRHTAYMMMKQEWLKWGEENVIIHTFCVTGGGHTHSHDIVVGLLMTRNVKEEEKLRE